MFGKWLYKYSTPIFTVILIITGGSILLFPKLKTEVDFKQFFPKGEPSLANYDSFVNKLGSSENILVIAITNKNSVFDPIFIKKIQQIQSYLDSLPEIKNSSSILSLKRYKNYGFGFLEKRDYINPSHPDKFKKDSMQIFRDFQVTQHFITKDAKTIKIILSLSDKLRLDQIDTLVQKIDSKTSTLSIHNVHILGRKYMESEYKKLVNDELKTSILLSFAVVFILLLLIHRSLIATLLPLITMIVSLIMLYGYMALLNRPLTIMSNMLPTIVLIVGISDAIHITSKFAYESLQTNNQFSAINKALKEIGLTTFINSFTTAIGFLTLLTMSMKTIQSFGVDAAVGLMICWVNSVLLLPTLLLRFNLAKFFRKPVESAQWNNFLEYTLTFTQKYTKHIFISFLIVLLFSVYGMSYINTNNRILSSLPKNNRLNSDFQFFDKKLGGGRSFELIINTKNNHHIHEKKVLENIEKLENYLKQKIGISEIISPVLLFKWMNQNVHTANWKLPNSQDECDELYLYLTAKESNFPIRIIDSTNTTGRLIGRIGDIGRNKIEKKQEEINKWIRENIDTTIVNFEFTGFDYMTDIGHQLRINNTIYSFLLEILAVSLIIGLIYKSFIMIFISFIANIIPIIIVGGIVGMSGIEFRGATTTIFAIGYVVAVDDTLHFINHFQLEKRKGLTTIDALKKTYLTTCRAIIMTSLILLGGFMILLNSSFGDVYAHGFFMSLIIIIALITELLITPILITYFFKK